MKRSGFYRLVTGRLLRSPERARRQTRCCSPSTAVAAEELGADGAYFRVHHFARQLSRRPLLAAIGAKTKPLKSVRA